MSDFTYQYGENNCKKEYFEWDNLWWDNAPDTTSDRIIIIGDSISCGFRRILSEIAGGEYFVDGIGTSKGIDNPSFIPLIDYVLSQEPEIKVIQFNNGLHGWHLDESGYEKHYTEIIDYLTKKLPDVKFVIATTTPPRNSKNLEEFTDGYDRVIERNKIARNIAEKFNLPINDFFGTVEKRPDLYSNDGVHLSQEGYTELAKQTHEIISKLLK